MTKIKIVTDSTIDLNQEVVKDYDITIVPLSITIDSKNYIDGVDITPDVFIEMMGQAKELPKSSQPAVGEFLAIYDELGKDGSSIISIHMTKELSGTVQSAQAAAKMSTSDVTVIDSMFISKALGFQVIESAKMAKNGSSKEEILKRIEEVRTNTTLYISVDTLENLVKGGRIGRGKALIGSLLNIKPIAKLQDGVYTPVGKVRSHSQAVKYLAKQFAEEVKGKTVKAVGIAHADAFDFANSLKKAVTEMNPTSFVDISFTTPIISTHTGKGAIGFMFFAE